jgi:hypothetical protein
MQAQSQLVDAQFTMLAAGINLSYLCAGNLNLLRNTLRVDRSNSGSDGSYHTTILATNSLTDSRILNFPDNSTITVTIMY